MSSLINTNVFDYVNVMGRAADAAVLRHECISNNLANDDTPGYKREDVDFSAQLKRAMGNSRYVSTDEKVHFLKKNDLRPKSFTDYAGFSYRKDGNNVDPEVENVYLAENQIRYNGIMQSINEEFKLLQAAMK